MKSNKRLVFMCSGNGGNLRFIKQAIDNKWLGELSIVSVLTDRECGASKYCRSSGIDNIYIDFSQIGQVDLINSLSFFQSDIIITNIHKILCQDVVKKFGSQLINLHYSLLPAFAGLIGAQPVKKAVDYGAHFTGVTVHCVDENLDTGRPLLQAVVPLRNFDSIDNLMDLVFRCGCISLASAINYFLYHDKDNISSIEDILKIKDRFCLFSRKVNIEFDVNDEELWENIRLHN
jgi:phosphoribosylglycinamide formyltransferase-1